MSASPQQQRNESVPDLPVVDLAPVVQTLDSTIHRINPYPMDKYHGNQLCYPLDSDLYSG